MDSLKYFIAFGVIVIAAMGLLVFFGRRKDGGLNPYSWGVFAIFSNLTIFAAEGLISAKLFVSLNALLGAIWIISVAIYRAIRKRRGMSKSEGNA